MLLQLSTVQGISGRGPCYANPAFSGRSGLFRDHLTLRPFSRPFTPSRENCSALPGTFLHRGTPVPVLNGDPTGGPGPAGRGGTGTYTPRLLPLLRLLLVKQDGEGYHISCLIRSLHPATAAPLAGRARVRSPASPPGAELLNNPRLSANHQHYVVGPSAGARDPSRLQHRRIGYEVAQPERRGRSDAVHDDARLWFMRGVETSRSASVCTARTTTELSLAPCAQLA